MHQRNRRRAHVRLRKGRASPCMTKKKLMFAGTSHVTSRERTSKKVPAKKSSRKQKPPEPGECLGRNAASRTTFSNPTQKRGRQTTTTQHSVSNDERTTTEQAPTTIRGEKHNHKEQMEKTTQFDGPTMCLTAKNMLVTG